VKVYLLASQFGNCTVGIYSTYEKAIDAFKDHGDYRLNREFTEEEIIEEGYDIDCYEVDKGIIYEN
jgi:hypothetical protein